MRMRLLDVAVATVCVACVCAPLIAFSSAANPKRSLAETSGAVDQRVLQSGMISNPLNGGFEGARSGQADGTIQWDVYSTAAKGVKLLISSDRSPAMRDAQSGAEIGDYGESLSAWSVGAGDRRFGFSVIGTMGLGRFDDGRKWRGFDGKRPVETGRRAGAIPVTRTTIKLRAELATGLPSNARPTANIDAIGVINL